MKLFIKQSKEGYEERFLVLDEQGKIQYRVMGERERKNSILSIQDEEGRQLLTIRQRDYMIVTGYILSVPEASGATLIQNMYNGHTLLRVCGARWRFRGNLSMRNFDVLDEGGYVRMTHCKRWGPWGDGYEINVAAGKYERLCVGIALCIDNQVQSDGGTVVAINS